MWLLYPYFLKGMVHTEITYETSDLTYDNELLQTLVYGNYILYMEEMGREKGRTVSPNEIFLGTINSDEETAKELEGLKETLYNQYLFWQNDFGAIRSYLEYEVVGKDDAILDSNTSSESLPEDIQSTSGGYRFGVIMEYDAAGNINNIQFFEDGLAASADQLYTLANTNPLEGLEGYADNWYFQNPQKYTFIYGMTLEAYENYTANYYGPQTYEYEDYGMIAAPMLLFMAVVALAALLLPFLPSWNIGKQKFFRVSCEPVLVCLIMLAAVTSNLPSSLVAATIEGTLVNMLRDMGIHSVIASVMVIGLNIFVWSLLFAFIYWSVTCLRSVFTLGIKRYFKERTWTYRICRTIKYWILRCYHYLEGIDLNDSIIKTLLCIVGINFIILLIISSLWFWGIPGLILYSVLLFIVLRKYYQDIKQKYQILLTATNAIAEGNLDVAITEDLGAFESFKGEIQKIQTGFKKAVEEEIRSQKMKTELVTNVSHDLKTPLTAIITYVDLLKDETISPQQRTEYVKILEQKSLRLKFLIEDLFEISKATSKNANLTLVDVDLVDLLKQVRLELSDKIDASSLAFRWNLPDKKVILHLDSQKTYRVFENLIVNILNYSLSNTRVYVDMAVQEQELMVSMKNISATELSVYPEEITERFIRGDASRNTEGSGLGLAIAKSFVELQNGTLQVDIDGDLFKVTIRWPLT